MHTDSRTKLCADFLFQCIDPKQFGPSVFSLLIQNIFGNISSITMLRLVAILEIIPTSQLSNFSFDRYRMVIQVHGPSLGQVPRLGYRRTTEESGNEVEDDADCTSEPAATNDPAKGSTIKEPSTRIR